MPALGIASVSALEVGLDHHAAVVMTRNIAGDLNLAAVWESPNDFTGLARLQQNRVRLIMHPVTHRRLHLLGDIMVDLVGFEHAMIDHHLHHRCMILMSFSRADVELMHKTALVLDDEPDRLAMGDLQTLRLKEVVLHGDRYGPRCSGRFPGHAVVGVITAVVRSMT